MHPRQLNAAALAIVALVLIAAAPAAAASPEFLPGTAGTKFTGKGKKGKFQVKGGATIECTSSVIETGELLSTTTALMTIAFQGCKTLGLPLNSLGDKAGVVLMHAEVRTCYINLSPLEGGIVIEVLPLHVEAPAAEQLVLITGAFVAKLEPENTKANSAQLRIAQKGGVQSIDGCRNASNELEKLSLFTTENEAGEPKQSGKEITEETIAFEGFTEEEFMT